MTIDRRIFVVGVPRSGTTLVQSLLAAHGALTSFTESHFFSRHFCLLPWSSTAILNRDPNPRLREFLAENRAEGTFSPIRVGPRFLLPLRTRSVGRQLFRVLDELARHRDRSSWVEKTPRHLLYATLLERLCEQPTTIHFVHVIRDGLETVASLWRASQQWQRAYDLRTCVDRWNSDIELSLHRLSTTSSNPCNDHIVIYEQLTRDPETVLRRLFDDLDLDWQPGIHEEFSAESLVTPEETWKAGVDGGVRRSGTSDQVLSEEQRRTVRGGLRHDLYRQALEMAR